jgi:hypothetical protein
MCTQAAPCGTVQEGVDVAKNDAARDIILIAAEDYPDPVVLDDVTVTLIGDGVVNIATDTLGADANAVLVSGNSAVTFDGVNVAPDGGAGTSVALRCTSAGGAPTLEFANGTVSGSAGLGIDAANCGVVITASTISGNAGGGISIANAGFAMVNNFIVNNGSDIGVGSSVGGVSFDTTTGNSETFEFNTLYGNGTGDTQLGGSAVTCSGTDLTAANNIIVSGGQSVGHALIAGSCGQNYSLIEGAAVFAGTLNIIGDPLFLNVGMLDYRIETNSPCVDAADPLATLMTDFDGQVRPQGTGRDIGADEAQ